VLSAQSATARISSIKIWNKQIAVQQLTLDSATIHYEIYKDSPNFRFIRHYCSPKQEETKEETTNKRLDLQRLTLHNNRFRLTDHRFKHHNRGVDFSDLDLTAISGDFKAIRYSDSTVQADVRHLTFKEKSGLYLQEFSAKS